MKIATRYTLSSVLKTALITVLIFISLIIVVELFTKMDMILNNKIPLIKLIKNVVLGLPEYMMMGLSVSFLFATTFFLSQLQANNELISLYNAGFSYRKIVMPIIFMVLLFTLAITAFNETVGIKLNILHQRSEEELFGQSNTFNSNITIVDPDTGLLCYATSYNDANQTLYNVEVVLPVNSKIDSYITADKASFEEDSWKFYYGREYLMADDGSVNVVPFSSKSIKQFTFSPKLFKNLSGEIAYMEFSSALDYLERTKKYNAEAYPEYATEFFQRVFSALPLLVLVVISCSINYNFKKNILLFSIIQSICTAVVYYVANMVATILGKQGMISAPLTVFLPLLTIVILALLIRLLGKLKK